VTDNLDGIQCHFLHDIESMGEFKRWMGERRPVLGIDTETAGFDWWRMPLRMVQVGDAMTGWSIPFDDWKGVVKEVIPSYEEPIVFHNFKFDTLFLERNGVRVPRRHLHDSEVLVHLDDASMPKALKSAATRLVHAGFAGGQVQLEETMATEGWDWATIPLDHPSYWAYAALDPIMTARIWEQLQHLTSLPIYDIEIQSTMSLERMERRGIRVDLPYCEEMRVKLREYARTLRVWARDSFGIKNLTSDAQVRPILLAAGWEPTVFTDGGEPSLRKEVTAHLDHPLAKALVECKHSEKMASTYIDNFLDYADDDRIHAKIHAIGTRTGRNTVTDPALQTLPRDDYIIRNCFIPQDDGRLVSCDYDQIEMRLLGHFSGSVRMAEVFASGVDIFTWMAQTIYGDPTIDKAHKLRQLTKTCAYAKGFGAGAEKFALTAGIDVYSASLFYGEYDAAFPELVDLNRAVEAAARERARDEGQAYVVSPYGRRHPLARGEHAYYKLVNYLIQGTAADIFKRKLVEMDAAGLGDYLVLPVHDEFILDVPAEEVPRVTELIRQVMPELSFDIPITVGVDVVDRWGDKYR
jgi:DNA polymerase-1